MTYPYQEIRPMGGTDGEPEDSVDTSNWRGDNLDYCLRCGVDRNALREMIASGDRSNLTMVNHILEGCTSCKKALGGK